MKSYSSFRFLIVLLLAMLACATVAAQSRSVISLRTVDSSTGKAVAGAVVEVSAVGNTGNVRYYTTGGDGSVAFGAPVGKVKVVITFIGYEDYRRTVDLTASKLDLGVIRMKESTTQIAAVVKEAKQLQTTLNADTVIYNASAFKVAADADAEGLIKKMPGIEVAEGAVVAQGENVKKIFVDGQEFFGDDVTTAIKTLPAEAIDKVEVFDKLSDEAEFSGIDDGEGYKAINFVTKKHMRNGTFGKVYAGLGYEPDADVLSFNPKYIAGGNVNYFKGKSRVSVIGLFNNINQQNFSFEDIVGATASSNGKSNQQSVGQYMVRPQNGVALVNSLGVNYSDVWGRKQNVKWQSSYFFNHTGTENLQVSETWYEDPSPYGTRYSETASDTKNMNHRLNTRLDWRISRNQSLMNRFNISYQGHWPTSVTEGYTNGDTELEVPEGAAHQGLQYIGSGKNNRMQGVNLNEMLQYRVRLGKPGRTLTVDSKITYKYNSSLHRTDQNSVSAIRYNNPDYAELYDQYFVQGSWRDMIYDPQLYDPEYQLYRTPLDTWSLRFGCQYNEPITPSLRFIVQYRGSLRHQEKDQNAWYCEDDTFSEVGAQINEAMTMNYNTEQWTHKIGPGLRYSKNKTTVSANVYYDHETLSTDISGMQSDRIRRSYDYPLYFAMARWAINSENSLRVYFRSSIDAPSVTQLQGLFDVSSPRYLDVGNRNLDPSYSHSITMHYVHTNTEKGRTFMVNAKMEHDEDHISASHLYNSDGWDLPEKMGDITIPKTKDGKPYSPNEITSYENLDGYWTASGRITYGFPLSFMKCNMNVSAGIRYSQIPSAIYEPGENTQTLLDNMAAHNYEVNLTRNMAYTASVVLGSNISEKVDFTLSWRGGYHTARNSMNGAEDSLNRYFNHTAEGTMKFVIWKGITLTASAEYRQYVGFTNTYDESLLLCNVFLGKKICRNGLGEIQIGAYDLFDQNRDFRRTVGNGLTRNVTNSAIGRLFMVQFVYNIRSFGVSAKSSSSKSSYGKSGYDAYGSGRGGGGRRGTGGDDF